MLVLSLSLSLSLSRTVLITVFVHLDRTGSFARSIRLAIVLYTRLSLTWTHSRKKRQEKERFRFCKRTSLESQTDRKRKRGSVKEPGGLYATTGNNRVNLKKNSSTLKQRWNVWLLLLLLFYQGETEERENGIDCLWYNCDSFTSGQRKQRNKTKRIRKKKEKKIKKNTIEQQQKNSSRNEWGEHFFWLFSFLERKKPRRKKR